MSSYDPRHVHWSIAKRTSPLSMCSDHFKTQEVCDKAVRNIPYKLLFVPDCLKMQEMCNEIVYTILKAFSGIPDRFKTEDMCKKAVEKDPSMLKYVPKHFEVGLVCSWRQEKRDRKNFFFCHLICWDLKCINKRRCFKIFSKGGYNYRLLWPKTNNWYIYGRF